MTNKQSNDFLSDAILQQEFKKHSAKDSEVLEGEFYSKEDVDSFLTQMSSEIKTIEDYASKVHDMNLELETEVKKLEVEVKNLERTQEQNQVNGGGDGSGVINRIVEFAEAEALKMKNQAQKKSEQIIQQGQEQARKLVKAAKEESQKIRYDAGEYLESIEQYKISMDRHLKEYNQNIESRSKKIQAMARDLSEFANVVKRDSLISIGPEFTGKSKTS